MSIEIFTYLLSVKNTSIYVRPEYQSKIQVHILSSVQNVCLKKNTKNHFSKRGILQAYSILKYLKESSLQRRNSQSLHNFNTCIPQIS